MALDGVTWPQSNPKTLRVSFGTKEEMKKLAEGGDRPGDGGAAPAPRVPHQRLVLLLIRPVSRLPAVPTEVLETAKVPAEVGTLLEEADRTKRVLQVGIHLHLLAELRALQIYEGRCHSLHVGPDVVEGDPTAAYRVLVLVRVDAGIDNSAEEVVEYRSKSLGVEHTVQRANKHGLLWVKPLARRLHK